MEFLIHNSKSAIFVDLQLRGHTVYFCSSRIYSLVFSVSCGMNCNGLRNSQVNFEVLKLTWLQFKHVFIEMMLVLPSMAL